MARITYQPFGKTKGKFGDLIFRERNGRIHAYRAPAEYNISRSDKVQTVRDNFAAAVKFASTINNISVLKAAWQKSRLPGSGAYHRIIKYNLPLIKNGSLTLHNSITPPGFNVRFPDVSVEKICTNLGIFIPDGNPEQIFYLEMIYYLPENIYCSFIHVSVNVSIKSGRECDVIIDTPEISGNGILFMALVCYKERKLICSSGSAHKFRISS